VESAGALWAELADGKQAMAAIKMRIALPQSAETAFLGVPMQ